jgi:adenylate cyclase
MTTDWSSESGTTFSYVHGAFSKTVKKKVTADFSRIRVFVAKTSQAGGMIRSKSLMRYLKIKSLQQAMILFLLVPVAFLLLAMGAIGFFFAREVILDQWKEASILKLEQAAHQLDMRLSKPRDWIEMFNKTASSRGSYAIQQWILQELRDMDGVASVNLKWTERANEPPVDMGGQESDFGRRGTMQFHRAKIAEVTTPYYAARTGQRTVNLISNFNDESGRVIGTLDVTLRFDFLLQDIRNLGWWKSDMAFLVDDDGTFLARTEAEMKGRTRLGETGDPLEKALLKEIKKEEPYGTILHDPSQGEVGGFYRIRNAPWTLVLLGRGKAILTPIVRFRTYYFIAGILSIFLIILLIRYVAGKMVATITTISQVAEKVAEGNYGTPLPVGRHDEIGQLVKSFNRMIGGLKERDFIRDTFGRYVDEGIAKELMRRPEAARLGGEKREVAVLMSDLRDFTPLSETLSPEKTIRILNLYFSQMIETIQRHHGIIVDFLGDAMLAFFDPLDGPVAPTVREAVDCALEMQRAMRTLNERIQGNGLPPLQMGIGVNSGEVVVGNIGSKSRAKYGIVGAPVNLTQRIQAMAKGGEVLLSHSAYRHAAKDLMVRNSFEVQMKGMHETTKVYVVEHPPETLG